MIAAYLCRFALKEVPTTWRTLCGCSVSRRHVRWYSGCPVLFFFSKKAGISVLEICWNIVDCRLPQMSEGVERLPVVPGKGNPRGGATLSVFWALFQCTWLHKVKKSHGTNTPGEGCDRWLDRYVRIFFSSTGRPTSKGGPICKSSHV